MPFMKTNIKLILNRTKKNAQGYSPIYLRITKNRTTAYISFGSAYYPGTILIKKKR